MTTISTNQVDHILIGKYAQSHFIDSFHTTYKKARDITREAIEYMLLHLDNFLMTSKVSCIHKCNAGQILKCEFKIANSKESAKTSGNRIIVYYEHETKTCHVLLVYTKTHVKGANETAWRQREINDNYEEIMKGFGEVS